MQRRVLPGIGGTLFKELEGAHHAPDIVWVDERGAFWVAVFEQPVERLVAKFSGKAFVAIAYRVLDLLPSGEIHIF